MKLALIRRQFAAVGGAELYVQRLLSALVTAGHEVHLYAEKWQGAHPGVIMHSVPVKANRALGPIVFAEAVSRLLTEAEYDVVFSLERTIGQDVYRAGDGLHRVWLQQRKRYASWWRRPFVGLGAFHANMQALETRTFDPVNTSHIIVNSAMVKQEIISHFPFPAERIHLIPNGVETARFQNLDRSAMRARFGFQDGDFVLLFVGSGWERKGLPFLLRLMRHWQSSHPKVKLLVVGKGRLGSKPPPNVLLAGPMPKVEEAYAAADLMTFLPIYEPCANVIAEALASGLPVITSRFNGASELIQTGINGHVLEDPADLPSLETAIEFWQKRQHRSPVPTALPLDLETNVQSTLRLLESVAANKRVKI
ncbi:MAG: glycosyltransferase family 4 protein [Verrucomicrobia bacterium]|nr:glycosyltransferase family 4 protein [Verrucomicrobiota bacterium]